jgi:hypothetical protein
VAWVLAHKISNSPRIADKAARLISTYVIVNLVRKHFCKLENWKWPYPLCHYAITTSNPLHLITIWALMIITTDRP